MHAVFADFAYSIRETNEYDFSGGNTITLSLFLVVVVFTMNWPNIKAISY